MATDLEQIIDWLKKAPSTQNLSFQLKTHEKIRQWCLDNHIKINTGDRVKIRGLEINQDSGWWAYRECLANGSTAVVQEVDFNGYWYATIKLDHEWTVNSPSGPGSEKRHWAGTLNTTPDGFEPPGKYNAKNYPRGRKHVFHMPVRYLKRVKDD